MKRTWGLGTMPEVTQGVELGSLKKNAIRPIWLWRRRRCEPVRCHGGRALFSLPNWAVCSAIQCRIGPIIWHSRALWPFCPSLGSRYRSHLVNPKKQWPSPFQPIGQSLRSSEHFCRVKSTVSTVPWSLVCTRGSMFRQQSQNNAETPLDCA